jgi:hypothetical protein
MTDPIAPTAPPRASTVEAPSRPLRIFHGTENVAGVPPLIARAQRQLGHEALAGVFENAFDYATEGVIKMSRRRGLRTLRALQLASSFDVFQIYFGQGLLGSRLNDVRVLHRLGKRIVFYFCGCDIRDEKATIMQYPISGCRDCFPKLCAPNRALAQRVAEAYADAIFVSTPDLLEFVDRSVLVPQPYDADRIEAVLGDEAPERDSDRSPTNNLIKGTKYLNAAVAQLQREGLPIDLLVVRDKSHAELLRAARAADLAVDQLLVGSYGVFAVEMMAMGVPVAVFVREDLVGEYPAPPPIHNASPKTIVEVLRAAVEGHLPLQERAAEAQEYVREFHHPARIAQLCLEHYG